MFKVPRMPRKLAEHETLNREKREFEPRVHKHVATCPTEWPDPNTILCKCGAVMGFVHDPRKVKP